MSWDLIFQHLFIVLAASLLSIAVGLPLGIWAYVSKTARPVILRIVDLLQTIPSLALLGIIMVVLDPGKLTVITGITLYSLLPIVRNTCLGLQEVDPGVKEAARGMGMSKPYRVLMVEFPLAFPTVFTGIRIAVVNAIGTAVFAAFVGGGGLGGDDGLHLHARGTGGAGLGLDAHAGRGVAHFKAHVHQVQAQGMAERDQLRGALGGHDAAHLGAGQHVALGQGAFLEQLQGVGRKLHDGFGNGHAPGVGLGAHVHHGDVAVLVQMGKIVLHEAYPCIKSVPCCVAHGQAQGKAAGA